MKWIVQLDYEFGEIEPNSIYFRRVCSDDIEYSFAYDTKREALEAFCLGQVAMNKMLKEREAEQKEAEQKKEEPKPIDYSRYCKTAMFDPDEPTIDERFAKIEERLTEIEGVLSSIGSPDYDLRKKVEDLEKRLRNY